MKKFPYIEELFILDKIFNGNGSDVLRIVGGAIRNFLLGKKITDYDLSCVLPPNEVIAILERNNLRYTTVGIAFGTIVAIVNKKTFEITSTREDIQTDGRHAIVKYIGDFEKDSSRRDFTFNALYLDFHGKIYDYHDGINDLRLGMVRFIGDTDLRIREDYLRILRFFRFFGSYGTFLDNAGLEYCIMHKEMIKNLSGERIRNEMLKILDSDYSIKALKTMETNGILQIATGLSDFDFEYLEIFYSVKKFLKSVEIDPMLSLALLLKNTYSLNTIRAKWKLSKKDVDVLLKLFFFNDKKTCPKEVMFLEKNKKLTVNSVIFNSVMNYQRIPGNLLTHIMNEIDFVRDERIPSLPINGDILRSLGLKNKKEYGKILTVGRDIFIKSDFSMTKADLIKELRKRNVLPSD